MWAPSEIVIALGICLVAFWVVYIVYRCFFATRDAIEDPAYHRMWLRPRRHHNNDIEMQDFRIVSRVEVSRRFNRPQTPPPVYIPFGAHRRVNDPPYAPNPPPAQTSPVSGSPPALTTDRKCVTVTSWWTMFAPSARATRSQTPPPTTVDQPNNVDASPSAANQTTDADVSPDNSDTSGLAVPDTTVEDDSPMWNGNVRAPRVVPPTGRGCSHRGAGRHSFIEDSELDVIAE